MTLSPPRAAGVVEAALRESEEIYRLLFESSGEAIVITDPEGNVHSANPAACRLFGRTERELRELGRPAWVDEKDPRWRNALAAHNESGRFVGELAFVKHDGSRFEADVVSNVYLDSAGRKRTGSIIRDTTERRRADAQNACERAVLEALAKRLSLGDVLTQLVTGFERTYPGSLCSVLLVEGNRLRHGAAPSLPESYTKAVDGIEIGPAVGSCGTAAYRRELVVAQDIASDPRWSSHADLALAHGLRACWSVPIIADDGDVRGTFAQYYREPRAPQPEELATIERFAHLASLAIARHRNIYALEQSEQRFRSLYNNTPAMLHSIDRDGRLISVSDYWLATTGYERSEVIGRRVIELLTPTASEHAEKNVLPELFRTGSIREVPCQFVKKNGDTMDVLVSAVSERNDAGEIERVLAVVVDVSDRRRAEAALVRHSANLEALHQITLDLLNRRGMDDLLQAIVGQASAMLDAPCGELMLKEGDELVVRACTHNQAFVAGDRMRRGEAGLAWLVHDSGQPIVLDDYSAWPRHRDIYDRINLRSVADFPIVLGGDCFGVLALGRVDAGRPFTPEQVQQGSLFAQIVGIVLDNARSYAGALRELAERERAQKALRESELQLASIIDSAMDGVVTVDADERILVFNASAEAMFRCAAEEAIGTSLERFIPPAVRNSHSAGLRRFGKSAIGGRTIGRSDSLTGMRADGEPFPLEASMSFVQIDDKPLYTVMLRDLTERRRAEDKRAELETRLRDAEKMEAIGTLAGGIAHDFNNIVAAIVGNVELARHALDNGLSAGENLDEIRKAGHRARDLVEQVLTFSQRRAPRRAVVALPDVVAEAAKLVLPLLPPGVQLVVESAGAPVYVSADATQLHRVLMNLATNASHAIKADAGTVRVCIDEIGWDDVPAAARASLKPGRHARLAVVDTGKGMDAATKARAFEPFFTTKPVGEGTGLGLAVVHGIVTAHDGAIVVDSAPASGTRFDLYLPAIAAASASHGMSPPEPVDTARRGGCILYVDDDDSLVFLASRLLRRNGFDVATSRSAEDALARVRAEPERFDLVVTDINMPGLSGLEMARELRSLRPGLPVVLTSGYVTDRLRTDAETIGVRAIVYKENTVEHLCAVVEAIARRCAGRERAADPSVA